MNRNKTLLNYKIDDISKKCHKDSEIILVRNDKGTLTNHIQIKNKTLDVNIDYYIRCDNEKVGKNCYIFNLGSSTLHCISDKLGLCELGFNGTKECYCLKSENQYESTIKCRNLQHWAWETIRNKNLIYEFILGLLLLSKCKSKNYMTSFRLNESCDFQDVLDVILFETIARELESLGITVMTYTHRIDLKKSIINRVKCGVVNGSNTMLDNQVIVVEDMQEAKKLIKFLKVLGITNYFLCRGACVECRHKACFKKLKGIIIFLKH